MPWKSRGMTLMAVTKPQKRIGFKSRHVKKAKPLEVIRSDSCESKRPNPFRGIPFGLADELGLPTARDRDLFDQRKILQVSCWFKRACASSASDDGSGCRAVCPSSVV